MQGRLLARVVKDLNIPLCSQRGILPCFHERNNFILPVRGESTLELNNLNGNKTFYNFIACRHARGGCALS